jgi:hypothetical protein
MSRAKALKNESSPDPLPAVADAGAGTATAGTATGAVSRTAGEDSCAAATAELTAGETTSAAAIDHETHVFRIGFPFRSHEPVGDALLGLASASRHSRCSGFSKL